MARYVFRYPSTTESEETLLDDLAGVLKTVALSRDQRWGFTLAVCEAFTNALLHGNLSNPVLSVCVELEVNESGVSADITDEGKGGLERIRGREHRGLLAEGGRGIDLIEHYADVVSFAETERGGLKVSISVSFQNSKHMSV